MERLEEAEWGESPTKWFDDLLEGRLGEGEKTSFWLDKWYGGEPLAVSFPRMYLNSKKRRFLLEIWDNG